LLAYFDHNYNHYRYANAGQLNSFAHQTALLVLNARGILWARQQAASLGINPPAEVLFCSSGLLI
jgi:hypothetical protein